MGIEWERYMRKFKALLRASRLKNEAVFLLTSNSLRPANEWLWSPSPRLQATLIHSNVRSDCLQCGHYGVKANLENNEGEPLPSINSLGRRWIPYFRRRCTCLHLEAYALLSHKTILVSLWREWKAIGERTPQKPIKDQGIQMEDSH